MRTIALIDYGSGNVHSAARALRAAANRARKTREIKLTADPDTIRRADRIVLPGVGHFGDCMDALKAREGLVEALEEAVTRKGKPFLGICVGMQLLADFGLEDGEHRGLGWIHGQVQPLPPSPGIRIPHMGWNSLHARGGHALLESLPADAHAYFVHSYVFSPEDEGNITAISEHGRPFAAAIGRDNLFGTQFHPEKSQETGLQLLSNFITWSP